MAVLIAYVLYFWRKDARLYKYAYGNRQDTKRIFQEKGDAEETTNGSAIGL